MDSITKEVLNKYKLNKWWMIYKEEGSNLALICLGLRPASTSLVHFFCPYTALEAAEHVFLLLVEIV